MQFATKHVFTTLLSNIVVSLKNKLKTLKFLSIIMLNLFSGSYSSFILHVLISRTPRGDKGAELTSVIPQLTTLTLCKALDIMIAAAASSYIGLSLNAMSPCPMLSKVNGISFTSAYSNGLVWVVLTVGGLKVESAAISSTNSSQHNPA
jgi:hypothetical protein